MKKFSQNTFFWIVLATIIVIGGFLRFYRIGEQSFWVDEAFSYSISSKGFLESLRTGNMSLFYVLAAVWSRLLPVITEATLRSLSALFSILTLAVIFITGRSIFDDETDGLYCGLLATLLVAINSSEVRYAQEFRSYSLTSFLSLASTLLLMQLIKENAKKICTIAFYITFTVASVYSHIYASLLIAAQVVSLFFLIPSFKADFKVLRLLLLSYFCILLLLIPLALLISSIGGGRLEWLGSPKLGDIPVLLKFLTGTRSLLVLVVHFVFALLGACFGVGKTNKPKTYQNWCSILLLSNFIIPIVLSFAYSQILQPIFLNRYLLMVGPYLTLLTAAGVVTATDLTYKVHSNNFVRKLMTTLFVLLFAISSIPSLSHYFVETKKEDWRTATNILATHCSQSLRIYYPDWLTPSIQFYDSNLNPITTTELNAYLLSLKAQNYVGLSQEGLHNQVCLVFSHLGVGDRLYNADLIRQSILMDFPNAQIIELNGVSVEIYSR